MRLNFIFYRDADLYLPKIRVLDWMEKALDLIPNQSQLMNSLFEFEALDHTEAKEEDGTPVNSTVKSVHTYLVYSCCTTFIFRREK